MKQILQSMESGETKILTAPAPTAQKNSILINTTTSLVSAGTERMLVEFGKASYIAKARKQPEKVKMVLDKVKTDGLSSTIDAVRSKLEQPLALGYCNVGVISSLGEGVDDLAVGQRVVSNGPHADVVSVSKNLCAPIPDDVSDEEAAFTVLASIGLQGIRLVEPTLGECVVVIGVGLIGLITVQLLIANGCRVLAIDFDDSKLELARQFGAETCNPSKGDDPVSAGILFSRGRGVDAVIITASSSSNDPVSHAAQMSRKRGRIVLVGVVGLQLNRTEFYEKELSFRVSCSYGPGRYDALYEDQGIDYPVGFVRWTEKRNFEAVLDMLSTGKLDVKALISHRFEFDDAINAYDLLTNNENSLGIILTYTGSFSLRHQKTVILRDALIAKPEVPSLGVIGAGNYASRVLVPAFKKAGANLYGICSSGGVSATVNGEKQGFHLTTSDSNELVTNSNINTLVVVTRHDSHAKFVLDGLLHKKNVFVEKPIALNTGELNRIREVYSSFEGKVNAPSLMVGFNRRFSPHVQKMKTMLDAVPGPKSFIMTMNAGAIPIDHWTQDKNVGGGRILGEACHLIDLMRFLCGNKIVSLKVHCMGHVDGETSDDKASIILGFSDGSFGTIHYMANGHASLPKERIEVFAAGKVLQLDNFRVLRGFGWPKFKKMKTWKQEKGQIECVRAFLNAIRDGVPTPIPAEEIFEVAEISIRAANLLRPN